MARKSNAGAKGKYNPATVKKLEKAIRLGATHEMACAYAKIHPATFYEWMNTKPEFSEIINNAQLEDAVDSLARIEKAARDGDWRADTWRLERRFPEIFGRQRIEHTGADGGAIQIKVVREDDND